jgi:hypothetical protein
VNMGPKKDILAGWEKAARKYGLYFGVSLHADHAWSWYEPSQRNVVGPMDYTPCTFTDSQHPHITSNGHELALLVAFESALQHLADRPEGYHAQPAEIRSFISSLPTVWDDTKLLSGYPSSYVVLARKSGDCWYIAGLNGTNGKKSLAVDLSFIQEPVKEITLYADGKV